MIAIHRLAIRVLAIVGVVISAISPAFAEDETMTEAECFSQRRHDHDLIVNLMMELIERDIYAAYNRYFDVSRKGVFDRPAVWMRGVGGWGPGVSLNTEFYVRFDRNMESIKAAASDEPGFSWTAMRTSPVGATFARQIGIRICKFAEGSFDKLTPAERLEALPSQADVLSSLKVEYAVTDSKICPALGLQIEKLESLRVPAVDIPGVGKDPNNPPVMMDGPSYELYVQGIHTDVTFERGFGGGVHHAWVEETWAALDPCWQPIKAPAPTSP
jgi:hypothetical protein